MAEKEVLSEKQKADLLFFESAWQFLTNRHKHDTLNIKISAELRWTLCRFCFYLVLVSFTASRKQQTNTARLQGILHRTEVQDKSMRTT